ncbi:MAG: hypothetical protein ACRD2S_11870 [Terriglobales bacterium]
MKQPQQLPDFSGSIRPLTRRCFLAGAAAMTFAANALPMLSGEVRVTQDSVFELRQYTLYGGRRDELISLFEKNFIESQNAVGADVIGTFRDFDDPDRFVWIRGFRDMPTRQQALENFYGSSAAWIAHKKEANATMVDSDNVLLLRSVQLGSGFSGGPKVPSDSEAVFLMTIYYLGSVDIVQFTQFFDHVILPHLNALNVRPIATLATNEEPNNFPRLPIREHDRVFLWMARWRGEADYESFAQEQRAWSGWRDTAPETVLPALMRKPELLRLKPTARSPLQ